MYINSVNYAGMHFGQSTVAQKRVTRKSPYIKSLSSKTSKITIPDEKYKQVDNGFKKLEVVDTISRRIEAMPMMMDDAFETVTDYVSCKLPRRAFIVRYNQAMIPLYKRIKDGYNAKEYASNYKPEINALNKITDISNKYVINQVSGEQFDSGVESTLSEYSGTELKRRKNFII